MDAVVLGEMTATSATLSLPNGDGSIIINSENPSALATKVARALGRDDKFEALVAALTEFRSNDLGGLLINAIDMREPDSKGIQKRLSKLVCMIDVILDAVEEHEDDCIDA
jgi:hypothetical protein